MDGRSRLDDDDRSCVRGDNGCVVREDRLDSSLLLLLFPGDFRGDRVWLVLWVPVLLREEDSSSIAIVRFTREEFSSSRTSRISKVRPPRILIRSSCFARAFHFSTFPMTLLNFLCLLLVFPKEDENDDDELLFKLLPLSLLE